MRSISKEVGLIPVIFNFDVSGKDLLRFLPWEAEKLIEGKLGNFIPMVDTSGSMEVENCIPLYNFISHFK